MLGAGDNLRVGVPHVQALRPETLGPLDLWFRGESGTLSVFDYLCCPKFFFRFAYPQRPTVVLRSVTSFDPYDS
jgi:hypothetical protein